MTNVATTFDNTLKAMIRMGECEHYGHILQYQRRQGRWEDPNVIHCRVYGTQNFIATIKCKPNTSFFNHNWDYIVKGKQYPISFTCVHTAQEAVNLIISRILKFNATTYLKIWTPAQEKFVSKLKNENKDNLPMDYDYVCSELKKVNLYVDDNHEFLSDWYYPADKIHLKKLSFNYWHPEEKPNWSDYGFKETPVGESIIRLKPQKRLTDNRH